jgi:hypothetical protein
MKVERVGREARGAMQRSENDPRMAAAHGLVLAHRQHGAAFGMHERRVIEVLADVVLVLAHGAVVAEREILGVNQVDRQRRVAGVLERYVPEPRGRVLRESQRDVKATSPTRPRAAKPSSRIR